MGLEDLTGLEIYYGFFSLLFSVISLIIGFKILIKYFSTKKLEHITIGLTLIFLSSPWWGTSFSFLSIVLFNYAFEACIIFFLENVFIPVAIITWVYSVMHLLYPDHKKKVVLIFLAICIPYEIFFIISLIIDPNIIGTVELTIIPTYQPYIVVFQFFALFICIITGILFSIKSMKLKNPAIKWRGRFLLIAFIFFTIGALSDVIYIENLTLIIIFAIISRILLISSAIEYYLGFFLPKRLANWLIKGDK